MFSLVLPAYNPGAGVRRAYAAAARFARGRPEPWEIVFVLDGCTDGTPLRLERLRRRFPEPRVRVLAYPDNRGKGHAVRAGLLAARGDYRLFTDVDLAYGFADVLRVAAALRSGAAVAAADRSHPGSRLTLPPAALGYAYRRRLQSRLFGLAARRLLPAATGDTQAGLKGMTAAAARDVVPKLSCDGFGFDCELLTACDRLGYAVTRVPVRVRTEGGASTTGAASAARMLADLWAIRRRWSGPVPAGTPLQVASEVSPPILVAPQIVDRHSESRPCRRIAS